MPAPTRFPSGTSRRPHDGSGSVSGRRVNSGGALELQLLPLWHMCLAVRGNTCPPPLPHMAAEVLWHDYGIGLQVKHHPCISL